MMEKLRNNKWLKIGLLAVTGLLLAGGLVWGGYWYGKNAKFKDQIQETPTPISTPASISTVEDETKDWKTYTNENLRYTIEYPREFKIDELTGVVVFYREKIEKPPSSPIDPYIGGFSIYDRSASGKNAREACDVELCTNLSSPAVGSQWSLEEVRINNSFGVMVTSTPRPFWADYYLASADGTRIVRVMLGAWSSEPTQEQLRNDFRLLKNILSTFKFLE